MVAVWLLIGVSSAISQVDAYPFFSSEFLVLVFLSSLWAAFCGLIFRAYISALLAGYDQLFLELLPQQWYVGVGTWVPFFPQSVTRKGGIWY